MPNWAVPDCMEHPRTDRRRLHYLDWNRWRVSYVPHWRLCFSSVDSLLRLRPGSRQRRCRYTIEMDGTPFQNLWSHYYYLERFTSKHLFEYLSFCSFIFPVRSAIITRVIKEKLARRGRSRYRLWRMLDSRDVYFSRRRRSVSVVGLRGWRGYPRTSITDFLTLLVAKNNQMAPGSTALVFQDQ